MAVCSLVFAASIGRTVAHLQQTLALLKFERLARAYRKLHKLQLSRSASHMCHMMLLLQGGHGVCG